MIIYALTNGFIDDVPVNQVREWEKGFHEFMKTQFSQVGENLRNGKVLSKEIEADLKKGIEEYRKVAAKPAQPAGITKADL
jgi:F-type H+-transporting ATPase subunit alpha